MKNKSLKERRWAKKKKRIKNDLKLQKEKNDISLEQLAVEMDLEKGKRTLLEERHKVSTSKRYLFFIFVAAGAIIVFSGFLMIFQLHLAVMAIQIAGQIYQMDFSPQNGLITGVVMAVVAYAIYAIKATKENTKGGITYLNAERSYENGNFNNSVDNTDSDTCTVDDNFPGGPRG